MESTMAQAAARPTHTFALAKSMAPRESTGNISSIGRFLGPQQNLTWRSLHLNLTIATEVPTKLLDMHRLHCIERTRQTGRPFGIAEAQKCKRGGFLCRAEAPVHAEKVPSRASPFETIPDLVAYIGQGPLLSKLREDEKSVAKNFRSWVDLGVKVCQDLGFNPAELNEAQKSRIFHYYLPTFFWCQGQLRQHKERHHAASESLAHPPPLLIGISAPQGCGKSTLVEELTSLFDFVGSRCAGISLDDFYLTASEQARMAEFYEGNKLLQFRGNAGSHDMEFGRQSIERLLKLKETGSTAQIPRYDKSANQGRGDRADPATWPEVKGPLEVILFEGWMLGFRPVPTIDVGNVDRQLIPVNQFLEHYAETFDELVGAWVIIEVEDPRWVFKWRLQAEHAMRAKGKPGMTDEQIEDFCSRFQPAYRAYLPQLYKEGPLGAKEEATLRIRIDESRNVHE